MLVGGARRNVFSLGQSVNHNFSRRHKPPGMPTLWLYEVNNGGPVKTEEERGMKRLKIKRGLALLLSCWLALAAFAFPVASKVLVVPLTKDQWRQDLHYLAKELPRRHANAFHTATKQQFERAVAELDAAIPSLQEHEIRIGLQRIVAMIGDAHTALAPPTMFHRYPLTLYWFGEDLRVLRTSASYTRALGARVVGVNGLRLAEVTSRVNTLIPHESDQFVRYSNVSYIPLAEVLHALRIAPDIQHTQWTFEDAEGPFSLEMEAAALDAKVEWLSTLKEVPLYRQRLNELIWFKALPDSQTVYLSLRVYPDRDTFQRVSGELLKLIDDSQPKRLVIDVRQSNGGDFIKFRTFLLKELKQRPAFRKPGGLYVITGRGTQSASMVNSIDLRKEMNAVLVGEPTGTKPNNYSENDEFKLPNSGIEVSYSTRYYKLQDQDTPSLMPDKLIEPSWQIYTTGRDPALEWILAQPLAK